MKRLIYLTAILMTALIFVSCSGMTAEQRKETSDLDKSVGNTAFVGDPDWEAKKLALGIGMR